MNIRLADKADIVPVSLLWLDMVEEISPQSTPNVEWYIESVEKNIGNPNYYIMLAYQDDEAIAFFEAHFYPDAFSGLHSVLIRNFYVKPEYDRLGVAELLQRQMYQISSFYNIKRKQIITPKSMMDFWTRKKYKLTSAVMEV